MSLEQIDAQSLKSAFITGAKSLEAKKEWINELNVFPVPDGDTGTNMTMTIMSAAKNLAAEQSDDIATLCKAIRRVHFAEPEETQVLYFHSFFVGRQRF